MTTYYVHRGPHTLDLFDQFPINHAAFFEKTIQTGGNAEIKNRYRITDRRVGYKTAIIRKYNVSQRGSITNYQMTSTPYQNETLTDYEHVVFVILKTSDDTYAIAPSLEQKGNFFVWKYKVDSDGPSINSSYDEIISWARSPSRTCERYLEIINTIPTPQDILDNIFGIVTEIKVPIKTDINEKNLIDLNQTFDDIKVVSADRIGYSLEQNPKNYAIFKCPPHHVIILGVRSKDFSRFAYLDSTGLVLDDASKEILMGQKKLNVSIHIEHQGSSKIHSSSTIIYMLAREDKDDIILSPIEIRRHRCKFPKKNVSEASTLTRFPPVLHESYIILDISSGNIVWERYYNRESNVKLTMASMFRGQHSDRELVLFKKFSQNSPLTRFDINDIRDITFPKITHTQSGRISGTNAVMVNVNFALDGSVTVSPDHRSDYSSINEWMGQMCRLLPMSEEYPESNFGPLSDVEVFDIQNNTSHLHDKLHATSRDIYFCDLHKSINHHHFLDNCKASKIYIVENEVGQGAIELIRLFTNVANMNISRYNKLMALKWCYIKPKDVVFTENSLIIADPVANSYDFDAFLAKCPTNSEVIYMRPGKIYMTMTNHDEEHQTLAGIRWNGNIYRRIIGNSEEITVIRRGTILKTRIVKFPEGTSNYINIGNKIVMVKRFGTLAPSAPSAP